jgi:hypothetical protein
MLPYVHHFWVTFTIGAVEQVQDLLLKNLTVFVNRLSSLNRRSPFRGHSYNSGQVTDLLSVGEIDFFRDNHEPA